MRQTWSYFLLGAFLVVAVLGFFKKTHAEGEDPRTKRIEDPTLSGIKTAVPTHDDMEAALKVRERELNAKDARIKESEERLSVEESRLKIRIAELEKLQNDIVAMQAKNRTASAEVLKRMVKTFETMAPKKAAAVFATLEDNLAVELMMSMKEKKVASLLEVMDSNRAMELSTLMANRRPAGKAIGHPNGKSGATEEASPN